MSDLRITELRSDLATMAKHGRLVGHDVSAPVTTHPSKDKEVPKKLYRDRHGGYWEINGTKAHKVPPPDGAE